MNGITNRITPKNIQTLRDNEVFVFGSNADGLHYGGAARLAHDKFGAVMGQGNGIQGKSYAINSMSGLEALKSATESFIEYARLSPEKVFLVTEIGCGIAGYKPEQIAPLFKEAIEIDNIHLPESFWRVLGY